MAQTLTATTTSSRPGEVLESAQVASLVDADPPFNKPSADLILRTPDDVNFHVWKCILEEVSPIFADMFTLGGQQSKANVNSNDDNGQVTTTESGVTPCIDVPESSVVLQHLLLTFYPPPNFLFTSLDELRPVIATAHKYQMDPIIDIINNILSYDFAKGEPLRVFCIATLYDLPLAQEAGARWFMALSATAAAEAHVDELRDIDAEAYHRLLACRRDCIADLAEVLKGLSWFPDGFWVFTNSAHCSCGYEHNHILRGQDGAGVQRSIKRWFLTSYQRIAAVLLDKPSCASLEDPALCDQAWKDVVSCATCRGLVHDHMRSFVKSLGDHVEERVSKITTNMLCPS